MYKDVPNECSRISNLNNFVVCARRTPQTYLGWSSSDLLNRAWQHPNKTQENARNGANLGKLVIRHGQGSLPRPIRRAHGFHQRPIRVFLPILVTLVFPQEHAPILTLRSQPSQEGRSALHRLFRLSRLKRNYFAWLYRRKT